LLTHDTKFFEDLMRGGFEPLDTLWVRQW